MIITSQIRSISGDISWKSDYYNVICVIDGNLNIRIGDKTYEDVQVLAWFTEEKMFFSANHECKVIFLLLDPVMMIDAKDTLCLLEQMICVTKKEDIRTFRNELLSLYNCTYHQALHQPYAVSSRLLNVLQLLLDHCEKRNAIPAPLIPLSEKRMYLYREIWSFLIENCGKDVTQAKTAAIFSITPQYLGRFLKETCNRTYRQLIIEIQELGREAYRQYTSLSDDEIEAHLHDSNPIVSRRSVKNMAAPALPGTAGEPPTTHVETSPAVTRSGSDGKWIQATMDLKQKTPCFSNFLINLGYAKELHNQELEDSLSRMKRDLGFQCGRICRITDLVNRYSSAGKELFDFSAVFSLLDTLVQLGITPFLELGYKELIIQKNNSMSLYESLAYRPADYFRHLEEVLPHLIRACINHYGQDEFDTWYFEISYPYTAGSREDGFTISQYVFEFQKIYSIIRSYSEKCRIGGPGFNDWIDPSHVRKGLRRLHTAGFSPDFYTIYLYPIVHEGTGTPEISDNPHLLLDRTEHFRKELQEICPGKEIYVTETNSNLSSRSFLNDSCYQAAWICHTVLDLFHSGISSFGYYLLTDTPLRFRDTNDYLFGGWGLVTDSDIPKPSWHAFTLLKRLGSYWIKNTGSCLITADFPGRFQFLLVRYAHPYGENRRKNVSKEALQSPSSVFENCGSDRYHIQLVGVLPGIYLLQEFIINSNHSNLLHAWKALSYMTFTRTPDARELFTGSELYHRTNTCRVEADGIFSLDTELNDNEVRLVICTVVQDLQPSAGFEQNIEEEGNHA